MNTHLTRIQVYLDQSDVLTLDELAQRIRVTRSQVIRDATKAIAMRYASLAALVGKKHVTTNPLVELIGSEQSKTGTVGLHIDDIYRR